MNISACSVQVYIFSFSVGMGAGPWLIMSEVGANFACFPYLTICIILVLFLYIHYKFIMYNFSFVLIYTLPGHNSSGEFYITIRF